MFIRKSKIFNELQSVKNKTREAVEREWKRKLDVALAQQKEIYDLVVQEKILEIETLNLILEQNKNRMLESSEREMNSKRLFLKAKEFISLVDYEFKKHLENSARSMAQFDKIRNEAESFMKTMLLNK